MPTLRDDLIGLVDDVRDEIIDEAVGLRLHAVSTRLRVWTGSPGASAYTDTDTAIEPKPRVRAPAPARVAAAPGKYEEGDRIVDRISAALDEDALTGGALTSSQEWFWLIDGEAYKVVGKPEKRFLEWRVQLRRTQIRP